ncbi:MAG: flavodoxin family protein [Limnochordia bacterium]|jgi:multimeric flavodoxin WrbA
MKITVITGTEVKGCTYHLKEAFLDVLREGNSITEYVLPRDLPHFCTGCKTCFMKSEELCPHAAYVRPIWNSMLEADLLLFATPVYGLRSPGQLKALLDHLCVHWMVHRPDDRMFPKKAVILTNAIGPMQRGTQSDIATSLKWLGVSHVKKLGIALMEDAFWPKLSQGKRQAMIRKVQGLARRYRDERPARLSLKTKTLFAITRMMHQGMARKEDPLSADNQYWLDKGWISL